MKMNEMVEYVQIRASGELNELFTNAGLEPLTFVDEAPDAETASYECGIYLASPNGEVYVFDGEYHILTLTFDGVLSSSIERSNEGQEYLSILIEWVSSKLGNLFVRQSAGITVRVDLGNPKNYFALAIDIAFAVNVDYGVI